MNTIKQPGTSVYTTDPSQKNDHTGSITVPPNVIEVQLAHEMEKRTDKLQDATIEMAVRLKQAREFMSWSASHVRGLWIDWVEESNQASREMNMFRMAFERESKLITTAAKDVKDFFQSPEYLVAHTKLSEMVGLLEKFEALKKSGTLDAFADFILKVTCK